MPFTLKNKVIVCDLDDTLYLERDYVLSGMMAVYDAFPNPKISEEDYHKLVKEEIRITDCTSIIEFGLRILGFNPANLTTLQFDDAVHIYREHFPSINFCPDVEVFFAEYKLSGIITNGDNHRQRQKVKALFHSPIEGLFFRFICGYSSGMSKPYQWPFKYFERLHKNEVPLPMVVYIGDNPRVDFETPNWLGWKTIRIKRPGSLHENIPTPNCVDKEITSFLELM